MPRPKKETPNRADGRYEVKITIGKTITGELIRKSFYSEISKADAKRQADEYKINQAVADATGTAFVTKNVTFKDWANKWLLSKKGTVKEYTYDVTYKSKLDKYILPYFGKAYIKDIKPIDIQSFFNKYNYLSKSMQEKFKIILHNVFESAVDNDLCIKNPVKNIKLTDNVKIKKHTYTKEEVKDIIEKCIEYKYTDILILLKTGIRRSELLGLKWSDINTNEKYLHITRAVTPNKNTAILDTTKSLTSIRFVPFDDELNDYVIKNKTNGFVVTNAENFMTPSGYDNHYRKKMKRLSEELNIPYLTPHELRHTYGTLLRENGADIYTIQKVMGHADINITAKIYVHNDLSVLRKDMNI